MALEKIPPGYHSVTPYLSFRDGDAALKWYAQAFGAKEIMRLAGPDGSLAHAEFQIGNSRLMMANENPMFGNKSAETLNGSPISLMLYVGDVDAVFEQAVAAGATVKRPLALQFYGDRTATLADPFGYQWTVGTHVQDVSEEEMNQHLAAMPTSA